MVEDLQIVPPSLSTILYGVLVASVCEFTASVRSPQKLSVYFQLFRGFVLLHLNAFAQSVHQIVLSGDTDGEHGIGDMRQCLLAQGCLYKPFAVVGSADQINALGCHFYLTCGCF